MGRPAGPVSRATGRAGGAAGARRGRRPGKRVETAIRAIAAASGRFASIAGRPPSVAARAPGRVNLIGEHTDYSEGLVLPCAIDRHTTVVGAARDDARVVVHALDLGASGAFDPKAPQRRGDWLDYAQGVAFALHERGLPTPGIELAVTSEVPAGAGLSSSAALGVALCAAWCRLAGSSDAPRDWAEIAHRGESCFVGVGCGILDQFASALGRAGHALRIDCRSRAVTPVPFVGRPLTLLLAHSGVERSLSAEGVYRQRVDECAAVFEAARRAGLAEPPARALRDLPERALPALSTLVDPVLFARARHVVRENARVDRFAEAMARDDRAALGAILREGQASLRDDYAVSIPELDHLCAVADAQAGVVGSRLTGAGFGGCTLHLVDPDRVAAVTEAIADGFAARFGGRPRVFAVETDDGAGAWSL